MTSSNPLDGLSDEELAAADDTSPGQPSNASDPPEARPLLREAPEPPNVPPAEMIRATPLEELPLMLRRLSELEAALRWDWWVAYQNYRLCRVRWINHYHEYDRLQITAAQFKAEADDDVITPMVESRHRWEAWQAARRARINVKAELRVRTSRKG
jgi:hypothetical protein